MAKDILITPADGDIVFDNSSGAECGSITQDGNNLVISNAVGDILLGDGASDIYIGDGTNNVDILFEQSGFIKADDGSSGVTLTIGSGDTTLALGSSISSVLTVGIDDTGYDVTFFGATSGKKMLWDQSADTLVVDGTLDVNGNASIITGGTTGTLTVGRNGNENMVIYVDDSNTTITGVQDSDTNAAHNFILNRTFAGSGANNFIIQKGGTAQLTLDTSGNATILGNLTLGDGADKTITGPLNNDLILNARPNGADEGVKIQIGGTDKLSILQDGGATFAGNISASGTVTIDADSPNSKLHVGNATGNSGKALTLENSPSGRFQAFGFDGANSFYTAYAPTFIIGYGESTGAKPTVETIKINQAGTVEFLSHITASGNISASGTVKAGNIVAFNPGGTSKIGVGENDNFDFNHLIMESDGANNKTDFYTVGTGNHMEISTKNVADIILSSNKNLLFKTDNGGTLGGGTTRMFITGSSGNVGIGTASPAQLLHVRGAAATIEIDSTTNESVLNFDNSVTTANIKLANGDLKTELGGSEVLRISSSGNVGIGTTTPSQKLDVNGSIIADTYYVGNTGNYIDIATGLRLRSNSDGIRLMPNGTDVGYIKHTGIDFIKPLTVTGNISASGTGSFDRVAIGSTAGSYLFNVNNENNTSAKLFYARRASTYYFELSEYSAISSRINGTVSHEIFNSNSGVSTPLLKLGHSSAGAAHITTKNANSLNLDGTHGVRILSNLTASGNISASGTIFTPKVSFNNGDVTLDNSSANILELDGGHLRYKTNIEARFGSSDVFRISSDNTNGIIQTATAAGDIKFQSGSTEFFRVDGGAEQTIFSKDIKTIDDTVIKIGSGGDLRLQHSSGNNSSYIQNYTGDLYIENTADDKDIIFKSDNGSSGVTEYIILDGGDVSTRILTNITASGNISSSGTITTAGATLLGNVGIGGAASSKTLKVTGTIQSSGEAFWSHFDNLTNNSRFRDNLALFFGVNRQLGWKYNSTLDKLVLTSGSSNHTLTFDGNGNISGSGNITAGSVLVDSKIEHNGDNNTFIDFQGDYVQIAAGGGESKSIVNNNGKVGIGTTTPDSELHVVGDISASGNIFLQNNKFIKQRLTNGTVVTVFGYDSSNFTRVGANAEIQLGGEIKLNFPISTHITASGNISASGDITGRRFSGDGSNLINLPTQTANDFTNTLKNKLDGIEASADVTDAANVVAALTAGDGITIAANGTIAAGTQTANDFTSTLKNKLDAIEDSADVTDATNVTSAGALMDSELTNIAAVKAINQSLVTTAAVTFATVNTGQGANELYDMDQNVKSDSDVEFGSVTSTSFVGQPIVIAASSGFINRTPTQFASDGTDQVYIGSNNYGWNDARDWATQMVDTGTPVLNQNDQMSGIICPVNVSQVTLRSQVRMNAADGNMIAKIYKMNRASGVNTSNLALTEIGSGAVATLNGRFTTIDIVGTTAVSAGQLIVVGFGKTSGGNGQKPRFNFTLTGTTA